MLLGFAGEMKGQDVVILLRLYGCAISGVRGRGDGSIGGWRMFVFCGRGDHGGCGEEDLGDLFTCICVDGHHARVLTVDGLHA